jgi:seryl-tRNA synthetase
MLDRNIIRNEPEKVKAGLASKNNDPSVVDELLSLDEQWRAKTAEVERLKAERNRVSDEIGAIKKQKGDASEQIAQMSLIKGRIQDLDAEVVVFDKQIDEFLLNMPNLPDESVPVGKNEEDNVVVREWGDRKSFDFTIKPHWELAEELELIDFPRGVKVSGSGFIVYKGLGAKLERSLISFMLDLHTEKHGYVEIFPPFMVNRASYVGTGQLPKFEEEMYATKWDDLYLISTAEVPVTNLYREEILAGSQLPIYHAAYSACFRREAGAAGKDTRGLLRLHEFNKVELVKFVLPETSDQEHENLCQNAETVLQMLDIPYRVVELCTGDLSFSAAKCYDLEIWSPGVDRWLEVSSCSNFKDFQARRASIRFRREPGSKPEFVHTLNGSGVALPRLVASILENYQLPDGSIQVPSALIPYLGVDEIRKK